VTSFKTIDGTIVPTVTAEQMRRIDGIAVQEFGIDLLQMMENAGRNLAQQAMDMLGSEPSKAPILIAAGAGGNGGGGLCCARHLHNRGCSVVILLDRDPDLFQGAQARRSVSFNRWNLSERKTGSFSRYTLWNGCHHR
jgi:NAD(P)H-hydrate epimerase